MFSRLWFMFFVAIFVGGSLVASTSAYAATVKAVKDNQIIIDMESDNFKVGDVLKIMDHGKAVGLAKVKAVKGTKAKAVFKGKAENGNSLVMRSASESNGRSSGGSSHSSSSGPMGKMWGAIAGFNSGSATAKVTEPSSTTVDSVSMSGSGFLLKGLLDMKLMPWLGFRGLAGITNFNVKGGNDLGCGGSCTTNIIYLGGDFLGRVLISHNIWAGLGVDLLFPLSKTASAISASSISNTLVYDIAAGYDLMLASGNYIPIQIDYQLFPSSSTVSASMISVSAGYVMHW